MGYERVHLQVATGIDAYEQAWDFLAKDIWRVLVFNLFWFLCFVAGWVALKVILFFYDISWYKIIFWNVTYIILYLPIWEMANIRKFRCHEPLTIANVINYLGARLIYSCILIVGYLCLILPGISTVRLT